MPKATKNTVYARNEPLGLIERIDISKETREKYKDVCKRRPQMKPKKYIVHTHPAHPDSLERTIQHLVDKAIDNAVLMRQRRLEDRISNPRPLASRITDSRPLSERLEEAQIEMDEKYPELPSIDFKKKFRQDRIKEFHNILGPTIDRFTPIFKWIDTEEGYNSLKEEEVDKLWDWFSKLQDIELNLEHVGHQWKKSKPWRDLRGACKSLKNVDCKDFNRRKLDIVRQLLGKDIRLPEFVLPTTN